MEEEMATQPNILAWRIPWRGKPGGLESMGSKELDITEHVHVHARAHAHTHTHTHTHTLKVKGYRKVHRVN